MAATAYPHMIFATGADVITKELLHEVLAEAYPKGTVSDAPLKSVLEIDGYTFNFWFDDEAEGLAQRYAGYLPEGARRRRLTACTTMIDFHGAPDPDESHRQDAERIVNELAELDGVWVFSEETKRFVAFDYGEAPMDVRAAAEAAVPAVAGEEPSAPSPQVADHPIEPTVESGWGSPGSAASADRVVPLPAEAGEPRHDIPQPGQAAAEQEESQLPDLPAVSSPSQPPAYQQPAAHEQPAPYQQPAAHEQPAPYQQPAAHEQPAPYQQPAAHEQPAPYQQPAAHEQPAAYQQPGIPIPPGHDPTTRAAVPGSLRPGGPDDESIEPGAEAKTGFFKRVFKRKDP